LNILACFEDFQVSYTAVWQGWQALDPTYTGGLFSMPVTVIAKINVAIQVEIADAFFMFALYNDLYQQLILANAVTENPPPGAKTRKLPLGFKEITNPVT
jgi:hypothetical protein